jgi:hypothetical protein
MGGMIKHTSIRGLGKAIGGVAAGALGVAAGGGVGSAAAKAAASQRSMSGQLGARIGEKAGRAALRLQYGKPSWGAGRAPASGAGADGYASGGEAALRGVRAAAAPQDALRDLKEEDAARARYAVRPDGVAEPLSTGLGQNPGSSREMQGSADVREGEAQGNVRNRDARAGGGAAQRSGSQQGGSQVAGFPQAGSQAQGQIAPSGMTYKSARQIAAAESSGAYESAYQEGLQFAESQAATYDARAAEYARRANEGAGAEGRATGGARAHNLEQMNKASQAAHGWRRNAHAYATEHAEKAAAGVFERSIHNSAHGYAKEKATRAATMAYDHAHTSAGREAEVSMGKAAENRQLAKQHAADPAAAKRYWDLARQYEQRAEEMVSGRRAAERAARQAWDDTYDPAYKQIYGQEHRAIRGHAQSSWQDRTFSGMKRA